MKKSLKELENETQGIATKEREQIIVKIYTMRAYKKAKDEKKLKKKLNFWETRNANRKNKKIPNGADIQYINLSTYQPTEEEDACLKKDTNTLWRMK